MGYLNPINKSLCLQQLCESNYRKIFQLVPDISAFGPRSCVFANNDNTLYVKVMERSAHTLTVELSHCFYKEKEIVMEPAVKIRIYLDAKLAEVLSDHDRASAREVYKDASLMPEILNYKWRLNYFLQKWLDHCLQKDCRFNSEPVVNPVFA
jgi:uncharacterized protein YqiB (DUF1249 family)